MPGFDFGGLSNLKVPPAPKPKNLNPISPFGDQTNTQVADTLAPPLPTVGPVVRNTPGIVSDFQTFDPNKPIRQPRPGKVLKTPVQEPPVQDPPLTNIPDPDPLALADAAKGAPPAPKTEAQIIGDDALAEAFRLAGLPVGSDLINAIGAEALGLILDKTGDAAAREKMKADLDIAARKRAQAFQSARASVSGRLGFGETQADLINFSLQQTQQGIDDQRKVEADLKEADRKRLIEGLVAAREAAEFSEDIDTNQIDRLLAVAEAANPQLDRELTTSEAAKTREFQAAIQIFDAGVQASLTSLQGDIDLGKLLTAQDFEGVQNTLDRELTKAIADNNIEAQITIQKLQNDFTGAQNEADRSFASSERIATEGWKTGERLSSQDFVEGQKYIDFELEKAINEDNFGYQKELTQMQFNMDITKQLNEFSQEEKIVELKNMFDDAQADKDVGRQTQILRYQAALEIEKITVENGFDVSMANLNNSFSEALSTQNFLQQSVLNQEEFSFRSKENALNRVIEKARLELQGKGVDADILNDQFDFLLESGVGIDTVEAWLEDAFSGQNLDIEFPGDSELQQAIISDYNSNALQFLLTNPGFRDPNGDTFTDADGNNFGISGEGQAAFNTWLNETIYGQEFGQNTGTTIAANIPNNSSGSTASLGGLSVDTGIPDNPTPNQQFSAQLSEVIGEFPEALVAFNKFIAENSNRTPNDFINLPENSALRIALDPSSAASGLGGLL